jgi:hypothetical protein
MLTVYAKNEADSISAHVLKRTKEEIDASRRSRGAMSRCDVPRLGRRGDYHRAWASPS